MDRNQDLYSRHIASRAWACKRAERLEIDNHQCPPDGGMHHVKLGCGMFGSGLLGPGLVGLGMGPFGA